MLSIYLGPEAESERRIKALDYLTTRLDLRGRSTLIQWIADGRLLLVAPPTPYVGPVTFSQDPMEVTSDMIEAELDGFVEKLRSRTSTLDLATTFLEMLQSVPDSARDQLMGGVKERVEALKRLERAESKLSRVIEEVAIRHLARLPAEGRKYEGNREQLAQSAAEIQDVLQGYVGPKIRLPDISISTEVDPVSIGGRQFPHFTGRSIQAYWGNLMPMSLPGKFTGFYAIEYFGREIASRLEVALALDEETPKESDQEE